MSNDLIHNFALELKNITFEAEMKNSYLDYAMSVIVGRALPDARDGLKPVHRRVLYSMNELHNDWNKAYKKSARIVGDTIGKYHPHGDTAVYDTMVRMAQPFSLRYCLIDGQGNFGSVDGDGAAAMRYTEVRLSKIAHEMLEDLDKETVDFGPNYDNSEKEPLVMPTRLPNLLLNGSEGIAVGMATKIPPHNLTELIGGCLALIQNPDIGVEGLMEFIPAPDFPTGAYICGTAGAIEAYKTGKGSVVMRAKTHIEETEGGRTLIVVDELPYQVNKKILQEKIAELVQKKEILGIFNVQDESDKSGMRLVIELKKNENAEVILNQLFKKTQLQETYSINMVALENGRPVLLNLKRALQIFIDHRKEVITRRTIHELKAVKDRCHVLEGYAVALENVDTIVNLIKKAKDPNEAKEQLMGQLWNAVLVESLQKNMKVNPENAPWPEGVLMYRGLTGNQYKLSEYQVKEILQLRLQKLTGLEQDKIRDEYLAALKEIDNLLDILMNRVRVLQICARELEDIRSKFGDARKSEISWMNVDIEDEALIPKKDLIVSLSNEGYIKTQTLEQFDQQKRGGKGKYGTSLKENDVIKKVFKANSHDTLLCFTKKGNVLPIKAYALPEGARNSKGRPLVNFLNLSNDEVASIVPVKNMEENIDLILVTKNGIVKRTTLSHFKTIRQRGLIAMNVDENDALIDVSTIQEGEDILFFATNNKVCRFDRMELRELSRGARGVKAMSLDAGAKIMGVLVGANDREILTVTELGYAKRTKIEEYRKTKRGSLGVRAIPTNEKIGDLKKVILINENQDVLGITNDGIFIRVSLNEIRQVSRQAQGVRLMRLKDGQKLIEVCEVEAGNEIEELFVETEGNEEV